MNTFQIDDQLATLSNAGKLYGEMLRVPALSAGVYHLAADSRDPQGPHSEDEIYYVIDGRASIQIADEHQLVEPGSVIFVAAGVEHKFFAIIEDLTVLVVFAPAENSNATTP